jgi:hypothetical protein
MITFISHDTNQTILIGGQSALGGASTGVIGPMPQYSISREDLFTGDGTYMNTKFNINITGTATLASYSQSDLQTKGSRQASLASEAVKLLLSNKNSPMMGYGKLQITPYGGLSGGLIFNDAKIISIELPVQNEESAGTQYLEYNFVFEAYEDASQSSTSNAPISPAKSEYCLTSAEETWELSPNSSEVAFFGRNFIGDDQHTTYTLTHTLSAVGVTKYDGNDLDKNNGYAWRQAVLWVKERLDRTLTEDLDPNKTITRDIFDNDKSDAIINQFNAFYMNENNNTSFFNLSGYKARNHIRSVSSDIGAGSYSVTDTWLVSLDNIKAISDISVSIDNSIDDINVTVNANGTIVGLSEVASTAIQNSDKYGNALSEYNSILVDQIGDILESKVGKFLKEKYEDFNAAGTQTGILQTKPISFQVTHDKVNGVISWNLSFSDAETIAGAISKNVQFTFQNDWGGDAGERYHDSPSVIQIVSGGPFIYNPNTTIERKWSVSVDLVMDFNSRANKPDGRTAYDEPSITQLSNSPPTITASTESWNPKTGAYNFTLEKTYI